MLVYQRNGFSNVSGESLARRGRGKEGREGGGQGFKTGEISILPELRREINPKDIVRASGKTLKNKK